MRLAHLPMRYAHTAFCRALVAYLKPLRGQVRRKFIDKHLPKVYRKRGNASGALYKK